MPKNIKIGNVRHGGQEYRNGITKVIDAAALVGDVVTSDTVTANKVVRGANGAYPVGVVNTKEQDGLGAVQSFDVVQVVRLTGAVTLGVAGLQGAGDGTVKLVAAGTASSLTVDVLGTQVVGGITYVAVVRA
ncbi:hypothetical protein [Deinococcus navajonensis]|uniref:Uncharacterized protein n=1 Tax=Deinococcus navajonensis TaxID=309884 RepID=A0ABV8XUK8_9DEIO